MCKNYLGVQKWPYEWGLRREIITEQYDKPGIDTVCEIITEQYDKPGIDTWN